VLGHARIPISVVSSIQAKGISTASSAPPTDSSTSSISPATISHTTASTSTSTSASTPASTNPSASAAGLGQSAKIGIGVGVSVGALLVALLFFIAFRLYRNSQSNPPNVGRKEGEIGRAEEEIQLRHELPSAEYPKELYTLHNNHEVEAISCTREL